LLLGLPADLLDFAWNCSDLQDLDFICWSNYSATVTMQLSDLRGSIDHIDGSNDFDVERGQWSDWGSKQVKKSFDLMSINIKSNDPLGYIPERPEHLLMVFELVGTPRKAPT
jgi:hypothetical protein